MCREELAELVLRMESEDLPKDAVEIVVVVKKGGDAIVDLRSATGFHGRVFVDESMALYVAIGAQVMGFEGFVNPRVLRNSARAKSRGYGGDTRGEGTQLGGIIVAGPARAAGEDGVCDGETPNVNYVYIEKEWGDHAPWSEVLAACRSLLAEDAAREARL